MNRKHGIWLGLAVFLVLASGVVADEATDAFESLYGDEMKQVLSTPPSADNVALAVKLLEVARGVADQPAFLAVLCEKVYELGAEDLTGYPTAVGAMEFLAEKAPDKKVECLQKCASLIQGEHSKVRDEAKKRTGCLLVLALKNVADAQISTGDLDSAAATLRQAMDVASSAGFSSSALQAKLTALLRRQAAEKQTVALKIKLADNSNDTASRKKLVHLYLVELDNAAEAANFLGEDLDGTTRKHVPEASVPIDEVSETTCLGLAKWYVSLAETPAKSSKAAMLWRAKTYYERFLDLHQAQDLSRTASVLALNKVEESLAKLGPTSQQDNGASSWIDCLRLVELPKHAVSGKWDRKGNQLFVAEEGKSCLATIPLSPESSYQLQVVFTRVSGNGQVGVALPIKSASCDIVLQPSVFGLEKIKEENGKEGGKWVGFGPVVSGRDYCLDVKVEIRGNQASIDAGLDGKCLIQWQGPSSSLRVTPGWSLPETKFLKLHAWNAAVLFRSVRLKAAPEEPKVLSQALLDYINNKAAFFGVAPTAK